MRPQEVAQLVCDLEHIAWTSAESDAFWDFMAENTRVIEKMDKRVEERVETVEQLMYDDKESEIEQKGTERFDEGYAEGKEEGERLGRQRVDALNTMLRRIYKSGVLNGVMDEQSWRRDIEEVLRTVPTK